MSDYLPGDVLSDILARLPAEDLVRCTPVCKKWSSLIKSPAFISLHLQRSLEDEQRNRPLLRYCTSKPSKEHYSLRTDNTFHEYKKFNFPFSSPYRHFGVVGSCNGLVCISDDRSQRHTTFIWNPVIRKAVNVPAPNFRLRSHGPFFHSFAFGFDSATNDYKIVRIIHLYCQTTPIEVEIYTINNGHWRIISHKAPPYWFGKLSQQAYVHGAAHWLTCTKDESRNLICLFDMKDEIFREMPVPESILCERLYSNQMYLLEYQGSILLVRRANRCWTAWMMKEYGVAESWAQLFTIDLCEAGSRKLVGMRPNGEILFATRSNCLLSYDYKGNKVSDLDIRFQILISAKAKCMIQ